MSEPLTDEALGGIVDQATFQLGTDVIAVSPEDVHALATELQARRAEDSPQGSREDILRRMVAARTEEVHRYDKLAEEQRVVIMAQRAELARKDAALVRIDKRAKKHDAETLVDDWPYALNAITEMQNIAQAALKPVADELLYGAALPFDDPRVVDAAVKLGVDGKRARIERVTPDDHQSEDGASIKAAGELTPPDRPFEDGSDRPVRFSEFDGARAPRAGGDHASE